MNMANLYIIRHNIGKLAISWSYPGIIDQNLAILAISLFIREAVKNTLRGGAFKFHELSISGHSLVLFKHPYRSRF